MIEKDMENNVIIVKLDKYSTKNMPSTFFEQLYNVINNFPCYKFVFVPSNEPFTQFQSLDDYIK